MADLTNIEPSSGAHEAQGQRGARLASLDLIRGVAILGILPVNMSFFSGPGIDPGPLVETWDGRLVSVLVMLVFEGKMVTLLSLLFGAGLALQFGQAQNTGRPFAPYYRRRMLVLFVIGLTHALLLSHLDILTSYAVAGFMALMFIRRPDRSLLRWAGGFLTWCYGLVLIAIIFTIFIDGSEFQNADSHQAESAVAEQVDQKPGANEEDEAFSAIENLFSGENEMRIFRQGTFGELVVHRTVYLGLAAVLFWVATGWYMLGCMLIGAWLIRRGIFHQPKAQRPEFRKWIGFALPWGLLCHAAAAVAYVRNPDGMLYWWLLAFGILPLALTYLSMLTLWAESDRFKWLQNRLQEVGRLALSNYLLQSVICGFVFCGYGLGLYGKLPPAATMVIVLILWVVQIFLSRWWLTRFRVGPAEWLWRRVVAGRGYVPGRTIP